MDLGGNTELRWLSAVLSDMREAAQGADFLVVGAIARDLLLHYGYGVPITRATTDVDLGVAVAGWREFRQLRDALLESAKQYGCFVDSSGRSEDVDPRSPCVLFQTITAVPSSAFSKSAARISSRY